VLRLFKTNQILASIFLLGYILLFFSASLWFSKDPIPAFEGQSGLFSHLLAAQLSTLPTLWHHLIAMLLILMEAIIIIQITWTNRLRTDVNLLPGVMYCLLACAFPEFTRLSAPLIANFFLLLAISQVIKGYKAQSGASLLFNAGFWIGIASLFYGSSLVLLLWVILSNGILRSQRINDFFILFSGVVTVYLLAGTAFFWFDQWPVFYQYQFQELFTLVDFRSLQTPGALIKLGVFGLLLLIIFLNAGQYTLRQNIQFQKKISVSYWYLLFVIIAAFFQPGVELNHLLLLVPAMSIFLGLTFSSLSAQWSEALHFLALIGILSVHYWKAFGIG
jgi:hypothetical protein